MNKSRMKLRCRCLTVFVIAIYHCLLFMAIRWHFCFTTSAVIRGEAVSISVRDTSSQANLHSNSNHSANQMSDGHIHDCITWDIKDLSPYVSIGSLQNRSTRELTLGTHGSSENEMLEKRKQIFQKIFDLRDWPADDPGYVGLKASGPGAMLRHAQGAIASLHNIINHIRASLGISFVSLFDVPCGDLQWMQYFLETRNDVVYTGADIVPDIIYHHQKKFKRLKNATFIEFDIVTMQLGRSYDLVLVRDLLQHLWITDAVAALEKISHSGSKFLLATSFPGTTVNEDVNHEAIGGRKSSYNLHLPPFSLEPPICASHDWNTELLSLWALPLKQIV